MSNAALRTISGIEYSVCGPEDTPDMSRLLAESFTQHDPPAVAVGLTPDEFEAFMDLLGQIDAEYRNERTIEEGQYLHLFLLGVAEQFTRRMIGQHLVDAFLANGATKGYTSAVTEATNPVSQHIFGRLGFKKRTERSYGEYRLNGAPVFASISKHGGPMTMDRTISV